MGDGVSALQRFGKGVPDVLVTDIDLPGVDGLSIIDELRQADLMALMEVFIVTGLDVEHCPEGLRSQPRVTIFSKPAPFDRIRERIEHMLAWKGKKGKSNPGVEDTALVLIGYQNDYFAEDGLLHGAIEDQGQHHEVLVNTQRLLDEALRLGLTAICTPIIFTENYAEIAPDAVGILKLIRDVQAFRAGGKGAEVIPEIAAYGDRILYLPGKRGLNAFSNTALHEALQARGVHNVVFCGLVTSLCIDSSARQAHELGYRVYILSDCVCGRTQVENQFYCSSVFPMYATVLDYRSLLASLVG